MKNLKLLTCSLLLLLSVNLFAGQRAIISITNINISVVKESGAIEVTEIKAKTSLVKNSQEVSAKLLIVIKKLESEGYKMILPLGQHFGGGVNMILFEKP